MQKTIKDHCEKKLQKFKRSIQRENCKSQSISEKCHWDYDVIIDFWTLLQKPSSEF